MVVQQRSGRSRLSSPERGPQLAAAAGRLFAERGYHNVSLADVAEAVGITAPAVYRHHRGKQALLAAAVHSGVDAAESALRPGDDLESLISRLADAAIERREVWVLLSRELRFLSPELRSQVQVRLDRMLAVLDGAVATERPELGVADRRLVVAAALAGLSAPSLLRTTLPPPEYRDELTSAVMSACHADLGAEVRPEWQARPAVQERGQQLLEVAVALFHDRGYSAVSLDEIGAAVGIAGPSVYHHYRTKADLLVAAFSRATEWLADGDAPAVDDPVVALSGRVARYTAFGVRHRALFGTYVAEAINLPPEDGARIRTALRRDFDGWVIGLQACRPDLDRARCAVRVGVARSIVNDLVRLGSFHTRPGIDGESRHLALAAMLDAEPRLPALVNHD